MNNEHANTWYELVLEPPKIAPNIDFSGNVEHQLDEHTGRRRLGTSWCSNLPGSHRVIDCAGNVEHQLDEHTGRRRGYELVLEPPRIAPNIDFSGNVEHQLDERTGR